MKWTPDTHDISFEIEGNKISIVSDNPKYLGRDPQEVYDEVRAENSKINESGLKDQLEKGEVSIEEII